MYNKCGEKMDILESGKAILKTIEAASFEAFLVGGAVRDFVLGLDVQDVDITTSATPDDITRLFPKAIPTGKAFGTMTLIKDGHTFEITTYREDGTYINHRKPESIKFSKDVEEDLKRRDFTINALLMNASGKVIDLLGGLNDLDAGLIRTIGDPAERFNEDALRLLRAFRFHAKLGFHIEEHTLNAIQKNGSLIQKVSIERIQSEAEKMLNYPVLIPTIQLMVDTKFADDLFNLKPGLEALLNYPELTKVERLYVLSNHVDFAQAPWRLSKKTLKKLTHFKELYKALDTPHPRIFLQYDRELIYDVAHFLEKTEQPRKIKTIEAIENALVIKQSKDLDVSGKELDTQFHFSDKSMIKKTLNVLIDAVLEGRVDNHKPSLLNYAAKSLERSAE